MFFIFQKLKRSRTEIIEKMATLSEPCYTILNIQDSEPYNELQIKQNLGRYSFLQTASHIYDCEYVIHHFHDDFL